MLADPIVPPLLPLSHFEERHSLSGLRASPEHIMGTITNYDTQRDSLLNGLLWVRELPARLIAPLRPDLGITASIPRFGLHSFTLLTRNSTEIAYGLAGQFWHMNFGLVPIANTQAFVDLNDPDLAKLLLIFRVTVGRNGLATVDTVTQIYCTDTAAKRHLQPYWTLVRPFSGLIRRRILQRIKTNAEQWVSAKK